MARTVLDLFHETAAAHRDSVAAREKTAGAWRDVSWRALAGMADAAAGACVGLGIGRGERVAILSRTRLEWPVADLAVMGAGAVSVPIYHSNTAPECEYILGNSGCVAAFVEDAEQLAKLNAIRARTPAVRTVVCFDPSGVDDPSVVPWTRLLATAPGGGRPDVGPDGPLTIVYTSGTTGPPKGTVLTHGNLLYAAGAARDLGIVRPDDVGYLFLPLAHVFARVLEAGWFATGHVQVFWQRDPRSILDELAEVRPTFFASVPRLFEKIHARVLEEIERTPGARGRLARWGLARARRAASGPVASRRDPRWLLARRLVLRPIGRRIRARLGGRLRFAISGGAPLPREMAWFFHHAGVRVCEGYGLTESTGATCVNPPDRIRPGTVGPALPGTEIRIAADGEILIRGPGVMLGYWQQEAATREVLGADGWLHTGDVGEMDDDGYVRITDRKKDIIVTAGGKKIAPQNLEAALKTMNPLISQVVAHGDRRRYVTALVTLDSDALSTWARARGLAGAEFDYGAVARHPAVRGEIERSVDDLNRELAGYEAIKRVTILDHDFEIGDQLTPTMKVKRKLCAERYADRFEAMYREEADDRVRGMPEVPPAGRGR